MTSIRKRLIMAVAEASMKNGVHIEAERYGFSSYTHLYTHIPEAPLPLEQREAVARDTLAQFTELGTRFLVYALIRLRKGNERFEEREGVFDVLSSRVHLEARGAALTELLALGLDAHPAFANVAAAETKEQVEKALVVARKASAKDRRREERLFASLEPKHSSVRKGALALVGMVTR